MKVVTEWMVASALHNLLAHDRPTVYKVSLRDLVFWTRVLERLPDEPWWPRGAVVMMSARGFEISVWSRSLESSVMLYTPP